MALIGSCALIRTNKVFVILFESSLGFDCTGPWYFVPGIKFQFNVFIVGLTNGCFKYGPVLVITYPFVSSTNIQICRIRNLNVFKAD